MSLTDVEYEKMMRFMDADMNIDEMEAFERELALNPDLRRQFDFEQLLRDTLLFSEKDLQQEEKEKFSKPFVAQVIAKLQYKKASAFVLRKWVGIGVAASVAIAVSLFIVFREEKAIPPGITKRNDTISVKDTQPALVVTPPLKNIDTVQKPDFAKLYKEYYQKDKLPAAYPMQLAEALTDYENSKYKNLQHLDLSKLETRGMEEDEINSEENTLQTGHYYKGLAFLETDQTEKAIRELNWVATKAKDKELIVKAEWYMALAYLRMGEKEKGVELLKKIAEKKNVFQLKAKALKAKVDS